MCDEGSRTKLSYNDYITILSKMQANQVVERNVV